MAEHIYGCRLLQTGTLDLDRGELYRHDSSTVRLTHLELKLLRYLDEREGQVVSAEELHTQVWGHASRVVSRAVDNTASRLRKKLELVEGSPVHLQRIPNEGFVFQHLPAAPMVDMPPAEPFFGRTDELLALTGLLETAPLIEVLGPGGIGKTRLIREAVRGLRGRVVWVDLSDVTDRSGLLAAMAEALGVSGPLAVLLPTMSDLIVVLDNVEQIVEVVREALGQWQGPRWVLTSRRALRLRGIRTLRLGPLDLHSAQAMLLDRAGSRQLGWGARARDAAPLAELITLLEGWPLAIELAAGRAGLLPPAAMLQQLRRAPAPPDDVSRPERHSSLTRTLEWSWSLLSPAEQRALARLSVFRRSFTIEAALAVLEAAGLEILEQLLDHSMIAPCTYPGDAARLRLLDTIARFAAATMTPEARQVAAQRIAEHLTQVYDEAALSLISESNPNGDEFRIQLRDDRDNLIAAMRALLDSGDAERGMWLARVLAEDLSLQQDHTYLAALVADALARKPAGVEASQDLAVQLLQGYAWTLVGRPDEGYARLCEVAAAAEAKGQREFAASAHYTRLVTQMRGWHQAPLVEAAEAVRRVCGDSPSVWHQVARADSMLGGWECRYAQLEPQGRARLEALLREPRLLKHVFIKVYTLLGLGTAALTREQPHEAERLSRQAHQLVEETGQKWLFSTILIGRALLAQGRPADAREVLEAATTLAVRLQHQSLPEARLLLSRAHAALGESQQAAALLSQTGDDLLRHPYDKTRIQWLLERACQATSPALAAELRAQARALIPAGVPVPYFITSLDPSLMGS